MNKPLGYIETNPLDYKGSTPLELGYGSEASETWYEDFSYGPEAGLRIGVFAAQPKKYGEIDPRGTLSKEAAQPELTIIMPASHDYRLEPLWMRRMEIMANKMDARVIGVDMPGTTGLLKADSEGGFETYADRKKLAGVGQSSAQLAGALRGDFTLHAQEQLTAIDYTIGLNPGGHYAIFGESMGAAVATDMIALMHDRDLDVSDVILYEMVNAFDGARPGLPLSLAKVLPGIENDRRNQYIRENTIIGHPMTAFELSGATAEERAFNKKLDSARKKGLGQQGLASAVNGLGMMHGRFTSLSNSLYRYTYEKAPRVTLVRGSDSLAASQSDYEDFSEAFEFERKRFDTLHTIDTSGLGQEMGHSHLVSLGRQAQVAEELKNRIS